MDKSNKEHRQTNSILLSISYEYRTVIQANEQLMGSVCDSVFYLWQAKPQQKTKLKVAEYSLEIHVPLLKVCGQKYYANFLSHSGK